MESLPLSNHCNGSFTKSQMNYLLIAMTSTSAVSTLMCIVTIAIVLCLKLYKYFVYRLAIYQVVAALLFSMTVLIECLVVLNMNYRSTLFHSIACKTIAFLIQYTMWVKLLFTLCLVSHLFCLAVCLKNFVKLEVIYILLSVLFPLLHVWIPFIHNSYGIANAWCWIRNWNDNCPNRKYKEGIIEQFVLWYGPLFVSLTVCLFMVIGILFVLTCRACRHHETEAEPLMINQEQNRNKTVLKQLLPLLAYPIVFYMLVLFPLIDRIYGAISSHGSYNLAMAHLVTYRLLGFFSGLALLVHVTFLRKPHNYQMNRPSSVNKVVEDTAVYTRYTTASTNAITECVIEGTNSENNE